MPRRHRAARDHPTLGGPRVPGGMAAARLQAPGYVVRRSAKAGPYRCPGCQQLIVGDAVHLVVYPEDDPGSRRHWHTPCWERDLRRTR